MVDSEDIFFKHAHSLYKRYLIESGACNHHREEDMRLCMLFPKPTFLSQNAKSSSLVSVNLVLSKINCTILARVAAVKKVWRV